MTIESGGVLRARLDALELRGRRHLAGSARCDALVAAVSSAAMVGIAVPLLAIVVAFVRPVSIPLLVMAALLVPALVAAAVFVTRRGSVVDRDAALALFDRTPEFKDRVRSSDEFLAFDASGGGFRAAAVAEAAPWLVRALEQPLDRPAARPAVGRALQARAPWIGAAVLLLILAAVLGRPVATGDAPAAADGRGVPGNDPGTAGSPAMASAASVPTLAALLAGRVAARVGMASDPQRSGADGADGADGGDRSGRAEAADPSGAGAGAGGGERPGAAAASRGGGQGAAGGGGAGSGAGGAGDAGSDAAATPRQPSAAAGSGDGVQAETGIAPRTPSGGPNAAAEGKGGADAGRRAQERRASSTEAGQASANGPGGSNPPQQNGSSSPPRPDQAGKPKSGASGDSGAQQQQGQGNTPGQGNNAPGSAQDALKRSRGLTSLLLAEPTVDRLQGTPGDGPSRSTIRRTPPQSRQADGTVAGARTAQRGDAGVVPRRPATAHDARLIRDYFDRSGGTSR